MYNVHVQFFAVYKNFVEAYIDDDIRFTTRYMSKKDEKVPALWKRSLGLRTAIRRFVIIL